MVKTHVLSTKLVLCLHGHGPILPPWADVHKVMLTRTLHRLAATWMGMDSLATWHLDTLQAQLVTMNSVTAFPRKKPRSRKGKDGVLPLQLLIPQDDCIARMHLRRRAPESLLCFYLISWNWLGFMFSSWIQLVMSFKSFNHGSTIFRIKRCAYLSQTSPSNTRVLNSISQRLPVFL